MREAKVIQAWIRILRDLIIVSVGGFILLHETVTSDSIDPILIGAGLVLLGVPPALRTDRWLKDRINGEDGDA